MNYCINQKAEFMIQQPIRNKNRRALQKMCDKKIAEERMKRERLSLALASAEVSESCAGRDVCSERKKGLRYRAQRSNGHTRDQSQKMGRGPRSEVL